MPSVDITDHALARAVERFGIDSRYELGRLYATGTHLPRGLCRQLGLKGAHAAKWCRDVGALLILKQSEHAHGRDRMAIVTVIKPKRGQETLLRRILGA